MKRLGSGRGRAWMLLTTAACVGLSGGCEDEQSQQAWSELATCLAGDAASAELAPRMKRIRLVQLNYPAVLGSKDGWPASCMKHANQLHAALDSSGKPGMLRRKLEEKLGCSEGKASCALANDEALIPTTTALWETARDAEFKAGVSGNVTKPTPASEPAITQLSWKALSNQAQRSDGPWLSPDGRALLLLKAGEGRGRPTGCELAKGFAKIVCKATHADVPELPLQTVQLVAESSGLFASGLLEKGLVAFNLETGKSVGVRGGYGRPVVNGLVVEDAPAPEEPAQKPGRSRKESEPSGAAPELLALLLKDGKPSATLKLPTKQPVLKPINLRDYAIWVEGANDGTELVIQSMAGGRLRAEANFKAAFKGSFHTCEAEGLVGLATWDRKASLPSAKPTAGPGKTQLTVTLLRAGAWSKPVETTLPFERITESELHCSKNGVSMAWVSRVGGVLELGRVDCSGEACQTNLTKLPGVDSKWWWLLSPMGDNVIMVWRAGLGETRLRIAPLASLATAPDKLLFDTSDYAGPATKDAVSVVSPEAALLLFRDERPVALRIGKDASFGVLVP